MERTRVNFHNFDHCLTMIIKYFPTICRISADEELLTSLLIAIPRDHDRGRLEIIYITVDPSAFPSCLGGDWVAGVTAPEITSAPSAASFALAFFSSGILVLSSADCFPEPDASSAALVFLLPNTPRLVTVPEASVIAVVLKPVWVPETPSPACSKTACRLAPPRAMA